MRQGSATRPGTQLSHLQVVIACAHHDRGAGGSVHALTTAHHHLGLGQSEGMRNEGGLGLDDRGSSCCAAILRTAVQTHGREGAVCRWPCAGRHLNGVRTAYWHVLACGTVTRALLRSTPFSPSLPRRTQLLPLPCINLPSLQLTSLPLPMSARACPTRPPPTMVHAWGSSIGAHRALK